MNKILIYDDEDAFKGELKQYLLGLQVLQGDYDIQTMTREEFQHSMDVLSDRQLRLRPGDERGEERTSFDDISVFVIDYYLMRAHAFLTGEAVAYMVRSFSDCGLIVGINQYPEVDFDLTLKGHIESFADLNINGGQLGNPNLWGGTRVGLHPWYWPTLPSYLLDFEKRVADARESLREDVPICDVLGFGAEMFDVLPRSISAFLGREPAKVTFRDLVMRSSIGLRAKDAVMVNDDILARVGTARISKWLERLVIPGQNILVDAPHLVSRYPSLLAGDVKSIETWNGTARLTNHEELGLTTELIEPFRLKRSYWVSRPVWFWDRLREYEGILEVREPWQAARPSWVFCEDASRFYEKRICREFVADVESPFTRRFVRNFKNVEYQPRVRFSL